MDYLLIKNGLVVMGNKVFKADVLIGNSKIMEIGNTLRRPVPGTPVIDAGGRFVIPGGIDLTPYGVLAFKTESDDASKLVTAEIVGGTTTVFESFVPRKIDSQTGLIDGAELSLPAENLPDYGFHVIPEDDGCEGFRCVDRAIVRNGISSCTVSSLFFKAKSAATIDCLLASMEKTSQTLVVDIRLPEPVGSGYVMSVDDRQNESTDHLDYLMKILWRLKDVNFPVLFSKLRFEEEVRIFQEFAQANKKLFAELDVPCFFGEKSDFNVVDDQWGAITKGLKSIEPEKFIDLLMNECYMPARPSLGVMIGNVKDSPVYNRPDKFFGIKFFSSMLYTLCVSHGHLAITDFVSCYATRPAKLMGLYPQKGVLREGADADIVVWNPDFERNLYCNYTNSVGSHEMKLQGKADFVFAKGKMVYDGETFFRENLHGGFLYRSPCM